MKTKTEIIDRLNYIDRTIKDLDNRGYGGCDTINKMQKERKILKWVLNAP